MPFTEAGDCGMCEMVKWANLSRYIVRQKHFVNRYGLYNFKAVLKILQINEYA